MHIPRIVVERPADLLGLITNVESVLPPPGRAAFAECLQELFPDSDPIDFVEVAIYLASYQALHIPKVLRDPAFESLIKLHENAAFQAEMEKVYTTIGLTTSECLVATANLVIGVLNRRLTN